MVYKHNPQAIIFSDIGPGARWMGNENGVAGETNWSRLNTDGFGVGADAPKPSVLNSGDEEGKYWIPAEVDVSIRPGWFYSAGTDDKVKTLKELVSIYHTSVGRNANLLLNVPVNRDGLIHPTDSTRLMELRRYLDASFKTNLAKGKRVAANLTRGAKFSASNMVDCNAETYWSTADGVNSAYFTVDLGKATSINRIVLQENIKLGQRIGEFTVLYWVGKSWKTLQSQTTIGYKRILSFPTVSTAKLRIQFTDLKAAPAISEVAVYKAPEI